MLVVLPIDLYSSVTSLEFACELVGHRQVSNTLPIQNLTTVAFPLLPLFSASLL